MNSTALRCSTATGYRQPVDLAEYAPPADAQPPTQHLEGRLILGPQGRNGYSSLTWTGAFLGSGPPAGRELPELRLRICR